MDSSHPLMWNGHLLVKFKTLRFFKEHNEYSLRPIPHPYWQKRTKDMKENWRPGITCKEYEFINGPFTLEYKMLNLTVSELLSLGCNLLHNVLEL